MKTPAPAVNLEQIGVREVLDSLADGAYVTDVQRNIVFWSRAAARITGWGPEDVVGRSCSANLLVHVDKDGHQLCGQEHCPLHRAMVTGEVSSQPLLVFAQHKQGYRIPVEVAVAPLRDAGGQVVGGIEVFRDLTGVMDDLRRAKVIQATALDCQLPADPRVQFAVRYSPEEIVGGDFYRIERLDGDRYAVMVADVMGHGVASALYTMQLRSLWEECRTELDSPARFLGALNQRLRKLLGTEGYFATAACVTFNAATGDLACARAGHPAPFLFRRGGTVERLAPPAPGLALFPGSTYRQVQVPTAPGDTLLLFTDGAVEITNARDEELGEEGLRRLLQQNGFGAGAPDLEQVERQLLAFSHQVRLPDDLTLLSLHRRPWQSPAA
jgi:PAS domain S-box-containing protein